jgi:hypothetical protein
MQRPHCDPDTEACSLQGPLIRSNVRPAMNNTRSLLAHAAAAAHFGLAGFIPAALARPP